MALLNEAGFDSDCPVTYSLVRENLDELTGGWEKYAVYLDENDELRVTVDNSYYEGGVVNLKLKAITAFNDPVYLDIAITEDVNGI